MTGLIPLVVAIVFLVEASADELEDVRQKVFATKSMFSRERPLSPEQLKESLDQLSRHIENQKLDVDLLILMSSQSIDLCDMKHFAKFDRLLNKYKRSTLNIVPYLLESKSKLYSFCDEKASELFQQVLAKMDPQDKTDLAELQRTIQEGIYKVKDPLVYLTQQALIDSVASFLKKRNQLNGDGAENLIKTCKRAQSQVSGWAQVYGSYIREAGMKTKDPENPEVNDWLTRFKICQDMQNNYSIIVEFCTSQELRFG